MPEKSCTDCYETDLMKCAACARNPKGVEIEPVKKTMPDIKEKMVELMALNIDYGLADILADRLISNGVTIQKWISVEERLPDNKEHDWVLAQVVEDNGFMHIPKVMEYQQQKNDWFEETYGWLSEHNGAFIVTHWMPFPELPKGE